MRLSILSLFALATVATGKEPVAAWVNKRPITEARVASKSGWILKQIGLTPKSPRYKEFLPKVRAKALSMLIEREVALSSKKASTIKVTEADRKARLKTLIAEKGLGSQDRLKVVIEAKGTPWKTWLAEMEGRMVIEGIRKSLADACAPCADEEAKALYAKEKARFYSGGRVKVSIILLDPRELDQLNLNQFATAVRDRVMDTAASEWLDCSKRYSSAPNAASGGHWDWKKPSELPDGVGKAIGALKLEEVTKVPVGDFIYVVRLDAVEPRSQLTFEKAKPMVKAEVMRRKAAKAWQSWLADEKKKADIRIQK